MRRQRGTEPAVRRAPRSSAFRSQDLVKIVRDELRGWLSEQGFKRLGGQAWVRTVGAVHQIIEVQCSQSGWDPRAGNAFIIEFEESRQAARYTGFHRERIWRTLAEGPRQEALDVNRHVAATLPPPDPYFIALLPADTKAHYESRFAEPKTTIQDYDVWFRYYDETDAARWAAFVLRHVQTAWSRFLADAPEPPSHRQTGQVS